jgi:hypothetical protein
MRRWEPIVALAAVMAFSATVPGIAATGDRRAGQLAELLPRLADRAEVYHLTALYFACEEEITKTKYNKSEEIKSEDRTTYDYLLENTEKNELQPYRAILSRNGKPRRRREKKEKLELPEPYAWNLLFLTEGQGRFQFNLMDTEYLDPWDTWVIDFLAILPFSDGADIAQWEGRVWVAQETLDILRIEARRSKAAERLEAEQQGYRESLRIVGMSTGKKPRTYQLRVNLDIQREGLRFPSRSIYTTRLALDETNTRLEKSVVQHYRRYVFYGVDALDRFKALKAPGGG